MSKERWSKDIEEDLVLLIKDWLRQTGRTQSELCRSLNLPSARMPTLIESLKKDFSSGGIPKIVHTTTAAGFPVPKNAITGIM